MSYKKMTEDSRLDLNNMETDTNSSFNEEVDVRNADLPDHFPVKTEVEKEVNSSSDASEQYGAGAEEQKNHLKANELFQKLVNTQKVFQDQQLTFMKHLLNVMVSLCALKDEELLVKVFWLTDMFKTAIEIGQYFNDQLLLMCGELIDSGKK